MTHAVSLHNHSEGSTSGYEYARTCYGATPARIIANAFKGGIDGLAITDNHSDDTNRRAFESNKISPRYEVAHMEGDNALKILDTENGKIMYLYNGIEFHNAPGHVLFLCHPIETGGRTFGQEMQQLNLEDALQLGKERGSIIIPAHPAFVQGMGRENVEKFRSYFDAVEGHNAQVMLTGRSPFSLLETLFWRNRCNNESKKIAEELGIPWIANPDSVNGSPCTAYTILDNEPLGEETLDGIKHREYLRTQIRNGDFQTVTGYNSLGSFFGRALFLGLFLEAVGKYTPIKPRKT